jgi:hypothetical protein
LVIPPEAAGHLAELNNEMTASGEDKPMTRVVPV